MANMANAPSPGQTRLPAARSPYAQDPSAAVAGELRDVILRLDGLLRGRLFQEGKGLLGPGQLPVALAKVLGPSLDLLASAVQLLLSVQGQEQTSDVSVERPCAEAPTAILRRPWPPPGVTVAVESMRRAAERLTAPDARDNAYDASSSCAAPNRLALRALCPCCDTVFECVLAGVARSAASRHFEETQRSCTKHAAEVRRVVADERRRLSSLVDSQVDAIFAAWGSLENTEGSRSERKCGYPDTRLRRDGVDAAAQGAQAICPEKVTQAIEREAAALRRRRRALLVAERQQDLRRRAAEGVWQAVEEHLDELWEQSRTSWVEEAFGRSGKISAIPSSLGKACRGGDVTRAIEAAVTLATQGADGTKAWSIEPASEVPLRIGASRREQCAQT